MLEPARVVFYAGGLDFSAFPLDTWTAWYRLALLLKGRPDAAEAALLAACTEMAPKLDQMRCEKAQQRMLVRRLREYCLREETPQVSSDEAPTVAQVISRMAEPMRSATALFYARTVPIDEIASICDLTVEELGDQLAEAREVLRAADIVAAESGAT